MTASTDRPAVRPRSGRRPIPPLIFLLVLAIVSLGVWWKVFADDAAREEQAAAACSSAAAAPPSLDPTTLSVRVFNSTDTRGLAQQIAVELQQRGFVVDEIANDPSEREITGAGEIRHGRRGMDPASFLAVFAPGVTLYEDTRATAQVDLVLGPDFTELATAEEIDAVLAPGASAAAACDSDAVAG